LPSAGGRNQRYRRGEPNLYIVHATAWTGEREGRQPSHVEATMDGTVHPPASTSLDLPKSICAAPAARQQLAIGLVATSDGSRRRRLSLRAGSPASTPRGLAAAPGPWLAHRFRGEHVRWFSQGCFRAVSAASASRGSGARYHTRSALSRSYSGGALRAYILPPSVGFPRKLADRVTSPLAGAAHLQLVLRPGPPGIAQGSWISNWSQRCHFRSAGKSDRRHRDGDPVKQVRIDRGTEPAVLASGNTGPAKDRTVAWIFLT